MIEQIAITNIGVLAEADLALGPGLTVITGETGAGKTMLLTAIALIAGERADTSRVRAGAERATVDATLVEPDGAERLREIAAEVDGELDDGALLVTRTVPRAGRARASLAGRQVPASALARLAEDYLTIHGQSEQVKLRQAGVQRETLDAAGGARVERAHAAYRAAFDAAAATRARLTELTAHSRDRAQRAQALAAGIAAIDEADPAPCEDDELKARAERLTNAEDLRRAASGAYGMLQSEAGALAILGDAEKSLRAAAGFDAELAQFADAIGDAARVASDAASGVGAYVRDLDVAGGDLDAIHERRAALTALLRVYGPTLDDALAWRENARAELAAIDESPEALAALRAQDEAHQAALTRAAADLRAARTAVAADLSGAVTAELADLAMATASLRITVTPTEPARHGADAIAFELRPHPGADYRPLGQGASGGELSRLMLALEVCVADAGQGRGRTFVFDEIDAGIGGATATKVGARLARLARRHQVLVVTHVAQVAAHASGHIVIDKSDAGGVATTSARAVAGAQRVVEVARMLGGTDSDAALRHANELITAADVGR